MRPLELYIHIPFCLSKCNYCDFQSAVSTEKERREYVEGLCQSIRSYGELAKAYLVVTIFIGGGTPSILEAEQMKEIFTSLRQTFTITKDAEITIEMNPGTVTEEKLKVYKQEGINRLSIGLQSTDDGELKELGRTHTFAAFLRTYELARKTGFQNINIDLISAIPHQTVASFEQSLVTVARLQPEHISAYSLIIEEGTPFYEMYGQDEENSSLPNEEDERRMYELTRSVLQEYGYHRYEISNYAKPGLECKHNLGYWDRTEYLGIGTGAASLIENRRFTEGEEPQELSVKEQMEEFMFLGLRKIEGVSREKFIKEFGTSIESVYQSVLDDMMKKELLGIKDDSVHLTEKGIHLSNYVMSEFLLEI